MADGTLRGRFEKPLAENALDFSASVDVDHRLARHDIRGSLAHVRMLRDRGILAADEAARIEGGLLAIDKLVDAGAFEWQTSLEDVHMNLEAALTASIGPVGGKLHTARSRNDQVATDLRLYTREACSTTIVSIDRLAAVIAAGAQQHLDVIMPGYTHLQRAQPVRLAHHLLAWAEMLERDRGRLEDAARRLNECPLGAGALAGTPFPIDRLQTATALGFTRPMQNSLDAVGDRDFVVECVSALALCAVHLSRMGEELVLWSTHEFGFVTMGDSFTTGSSIMPQKKNPDIAELVRGKTGRVIGDLVALLVLLKGLPLAYNRDLQEDKRPLFDAFDTVIASLNVLRGAIATSRFHVDRMQDATRAGHLDATELADYLAARGVPFREAHGVAGALVIEANKRACTLAELPLSVFQHSHAQFDEGVYDVLSLEHGVERRDVIGGPSRRQVELALRSLFERLSERGIDVAREAREAGHSG